MTHKQSIPTRKSPRPPSDSPVPQHISWLLRLGEWGRAYWPLGADRFVLTGQPLPYKRLVDVETGFVRGRLGYAAEERMLREAGVLPHGERLVILLSHPRAPGSHRISPEDNVELERMTDAELEHILARNGIDHERAKEFSTRCLSNRFQSRKPYCLTTLRAERVPWAVVSVHFPMPVASNLQRLLHFRNSEAVNQLVQLGGLFYSATVTPRCDAICYFVTFREAVPASGLDQLRRTMASALAFLRPTQITCSFPEHLGDVGCAPGPSSGSLFDPLTGRRLPDATWCRTPLVGASLLQSLRSPAGNEDPRGPSFPEITEVIAACGLEPSSRWGFRDLWASERVMPDGTRSHSRKFALIIPGKEYGPPEARFAGDNLSAELYQAQLRRGREFFANTFGQSHPRWICVDYDVKPLETDRGVSSRFAVDGAWLRDHIDQSEVDRWRGLGLHPEFRLSGRGFYIEFFFPVGVPAPVLKELGHRSTRLLKAERIEVGFRKRHHLITASGFRIIEDVSSLSYLVRMPGSVHHSTGAVSKYLDGSFTPSSSRSCPLAASRFVELSPPSSPETPSLHTSVHASPPPPPLENSHGRQCTYLPQAHATPAPPPDDDTGPPKPIKGHDQASPLSRTNEGDDGTSVPFRPLTYMRDGHLMLNRAQRAILIEAIVRDILLHDRRKAGPAPDPAPYEAAATCLVNQACRTAGHFRLGTRQVQLRISELTGKTERYRNRASRALKALVGTGYISLVTGHLRRGEMIPGAGPCPKSEAAKYSANFPKLLEMTKTSIAQRHAPSGCARKS